MYLLLFCIVTFSMAVAKPVPEDRISKESVAMNILPEAATTFTGLIGSDDPDIALSETAVSGIKIDQVQETATTQSLPYLHDVELHDQDVGQQRQPDSLSNSVPDAVTFSPDTNLTPPIGTKFCKSKEVSLCCKGDKFEYQIDRYAFPLNAERAALIIATWNNSPHLEGFPDSAIGYRNCPDFSGRVNCENMNGKPTCCQWHADIGEDKVPYGFVCRTINLAFQVKQSHNLNGIS